MEFYKDRSGWIASAVFFACYANGQVSLNRFYFHEMSDNLGNVYTMVGSGSYGGYIEKTGRTITTEIDEKATSIIITPLVTIYKEKSEQNQEEPGIENELAKPPFKLEPIEVPLK